MKSTFRLSAVALAAALNMAGATALFAADAQPLRTVVPNQQIGFDAGPEHISGVFRPAQGRCALNVTMVKSFVSENDPTGLPAESLQVTVEPGKTAVLETSEGEEARFECLPGAQAMMATVHDQVAAVLVP
jgi:hypothetical protein